ncbi:hypothetical protein G4228_009112 [Cervus hanglu yarkandensis]|nr:hypothetical protein G4228_009112 [Cervus hanglu yarkandensis]
MFEKTAKFIRGNLQLLVIRSYGTDCFRLDNDRTVYYVNEMILKLIVGISGDKPVLLGRNFGKFPKTHKFQLDVTALDYLAPYPKNGASQTRLQEGRHHNYGGISSSRHWGVCWHEETLILNHQEDLGLCRRA